MIPFPIAAMIVLTPLIVIGALVVAVSDRLKRRKPIAFSAPSRPQRG
jgi:hypothetical protein